MTHRNIGFSFNYKNHPSAAYSPKWQVTLIAVEDTLCNAYSLPYLSQVHICMELYNKERALKKLLVGIIIMVMYSGGGRPWQIMLPGLA